jgi:Fe-S cluster assembly ATP-binding protein
MLKIENLIVATCGTTILHGINLLINPGEVHVIMGPNGSGKSTLSKVIAGHKDYEVLGGSISFNGVDLLALSPLDRALMGVFLSFQYPIEIPGVATIQFLKSAVNAVREAQGKQSLDAIEFLSFIREKCAMLGMEEALLYRSLNEGFSGGEKKRSEILQMMALEPQFAVLDELDSGLDIDALRVIAEGVNAMRNSTRAFLLVTHYQRLLDYIVPDKVHVLYNGKIVRSGDNHLAKELETRGYGWITESL